MFKKKDNGINTNNTASEQADNTISRVQNPYFWTGIFGAVLSLMYSAGIDVLSIHTWGQLFEEVVKVFNSPALLILFIMNITGTTVNPTTKGYKDR